MTKALELLEGKRVNIFTDSAYGHGAIHVDGPQWVWRSFLTTANTPVRHKEQLEDLIKAVLLPREVAVMECKGHQKNPTLVAERNEVANLAAV